MIYIIGKITYIGLNYIHLETNYIGRKVIVKQNENLTLNKITKFYTSEITIETNKGQSFEQIYGFTDFNDCILFNRLISLPSIGPKTALYVLDQDLNLISSYIVNKDIKGLSSIKGLNSKTAQVIVNNLYDLFKTKNYKHTENNDKEDQTRSIEDEDKYIQIIESLRSLGYSKNEIEYGISKLEMQDSDEFVVEDVLAAIIKNISTRKLS